MLVGLCVFLLYSFGDKIFLAMIRGKRLSGERFLCNKIRSLSLWMGLKEVKVFSAEMNTTNIFCLDSWFSNPSILISNNFFKGLSENEIERCLTDALIKHKKNRVKQDLVVSFLVNILKSPVFIFNKSKFTSPLSFVWTIFLTPITKMKKEVLKNKELDDKFALSYLSHNKRLKNDEISDLSFVSLMSKDLVLYNFSDENLSNILTRGTVSEVSL